MPVGGSITKPTSNRSVSSNLNLLASFWIAFSVLGFAKPFSSRAKVCDGKHASIEADAIEQGWSLTKTELAVLRSERPKAPEQSATNRTYTREILEAAACLSVGIDEKTLLASYGERTLEAADPIRHIGLRELVAECARLEGIDVPRVFGDGTATIRAGFSTMSLPGILENVMNKTLLAAYENTPIAAFDLCSVGTVATSRKCHGIVCSAPVALSRSHPTAS